MVTVGIVGESGLVGEKLFSLFNNELSGKVLLRLFGRSTVGKRRLFGTKWIVVEDTSQVVEGKLDYAVFVADEETSLKYIPQLSEKGTVCIDNSSAFRLREDVPLVVPTVNQSAISNAHIIANPNCVTIPVAMVLHALATLCPTKIVVATYQSASGGGREGLLDLTLKRKPPHTKCFPLQLYDNILPVVGSVTPDGYTTEEHKLQNECCKILASPQLAVNCFCARVPVTVGHSSFVNITFAEEVDVARVKALLSNAPDILTFDGIEPTPKMTRNTKYVGVGRIVKDSTANAVNLFVVSDNLLRGAAYNAYEILTLLLDKQSRKCQ